MDVDAPHHPIATKRDFFIHLFTITCGLLIALSLEAGVEWTHHRALVREARANIRQEINDNQKAAAQDIQSVNQDEARFKTNLATERDMRAHPVGFHFKLQFNFEWSSMSDSAWKTAQDTGAFAYMPYSEVQQYADIYAQQAILNTTAVQIFRQQTEAFAPLLTEADVDALPKDEMARLLHESAVAEIDLHTLAQMLVELQDQDAKFLSGK